MMRMNKIISPYLIYMINIILLVILISLILFKFFWHNRNIENYQDLQNPDLPLYVDNPFNGEEVYNYGYGKNWYRKPKSNGLPYYLLKSNLTDPVNVVLPEQLNPTNRKYVMGIIDFNQDFYNKINNSDVGEYINLSGITDYNKNVLTGDELSDDEKNLYLMNLNSETWKNRSKEYNPDLDFNFKNKYIKSGIPDVNKINEEVIRRINLAQAGLLTDQELLTFGIKDYNILIYKISNIEISNDNIIYELRIVLYRDELKFTPYFYFKGFVVDDKVKVFNFEFVGYFTTDMLLMTNGVEIGNDKLYTYYDINKNYRYYDYKINDDLERTVYARQKYLDSYKMRNQYTCFSLNINNYINPTTDASIYTNDKTKETCQSRFDSYGAPKTPGVWDKPCSSDFECHYFSSNKNYPNKRGKCGNDGFCELPVGMLNIGYHYNTTIQNKRPLCYNCNSKQWFPVTNLGNCCWEQATDRKKYPFLKTPDFAFSNDVNDRLNYANSKDCVVNSEGKTICDY